MSVDKYVKFISEQQKSMVNAGFANEINEDLEFDSEDYVDMLHTYIEALESHFEDEDLEQIQEVSQGLLKNYMKAAKKDKAAASETSRSIPYSGHKLDKKGMMVRQYRNDAERKQSQGAAKRYEKRFDGIDLAKKKLAKPDVKVKATE